MFVPIFVLCQCRFAVSEYDDRLAMLAAQWDYLDDNHGYATTHGVEAFTEWFAGNDHAAIGKLINQTGKFLKMWRVLIWKTPAPYDYYNIPLMFGLIGDAIGDVPPEYELTVIKMIAAFVDPDTVDDHRHAWMLLTDAYRASMYDKPFDMEYHADWVQRFRSWA